MVNCIIIEDQLPAQRILKKYIKEKSQLHLIGTFTNVLSANESLKNNTVDLIFLDIHLPNISGIDFLKSLENPPNVILCTAFSDFAIESYELNVIDYLLKPFSFKRFDIAVTKALKKIIIEHLQIEKTPLKDDRIYIKSGYEHYKVIIDRIIYINSDADYTDIYTENNKFISSESLKHWEEKLSEFQFIRVHKSYIINLKKINKATTRFIFMEGNYKIPIGRTYKNMVLDNLKL